MNNIVLIGYMGAGKSTVAKALAQRLDKKVIDMDFEIEREEGRSIRDIFIEEGEPYFRQLESEYLESLKAKKDKIIATGGGVILKESNITFLEDSGIIIFLQADVQHIYRNIKGDDSRPLLDVEDVALAIKKQLELREPYYLKAANVIIQTSGKDVDAICDEIMAIL